MTNEPKPQTLTLNKEFRHAYYQGKSKATPYFVCYMVKGQSGQVRYGITTSKKIGNAVKRNHARRLIRAAFWSVMEQAAVGKDYVFVAREGILTAKSYQVAAAMKKCLRSLSQPGTDAGRKERNRRTASPKKTDLSGN
ncbi:MAG TPA: ribonuclease P protein component [Candidatus Faecivivens stercorigallinarum]|nr:ribonuclease P protein component [Candidatus Faecivivens stercorigallinarum]